MHDYAVTAHYEAEHYWSSCRDIPEAHSAGDTLAALLDNAQEGLCSALKIYVNQGRRIPPASAPAPGQHPVQLSVQTMAKIALWNALCDQGLRVADMARRLGVSHTVAARLVDFEHDSKLERLEGALANLEDIYVAERRMIEIRAGRTETISIEEVQIIE